MDVKKFNVNKVRNSLIFIASFFLTLHVLNLILGRPSWTITLLIDLNKEANLPTWFSSMLWAVCALGAYLCAQSLESFDKKQSRFWKITTGLFLFLSCDEVSQLHERFARVLNGKFFNLDFWGAWVLFFGPFIIIGFSVFLYYLFQYTKNQRESFNWIFNGIILFITVFIY